MGLQMCPYLVGLLPGGRVPGPLQTKLDASAASICCGGGNDHAKDGWKDMHTGKTGRLSGSNFAQRTSLEQTKYYTE